MIIGFLFLSTEQPEISTLSLTCQYVEIYTVSFCESQLRVRSEDKWRQNPLRHFSPLCVF